ncbi:hypothetical protein PENTCL1PPCAC_23115 [Pristionchus entomophagus]|uniref:Uncharacterized protein n=1 Tax=Pristionchus entomophagus TaxID=358040 RepID=A0AAV5U247_9BILA|nr:hypothetical protein PENTCL1PPCAC_23115 [Pristionchus entomophagus]
MSDWIQEIMRGETSGREWGGGGRGMRDGRESDSLDLLSHAHLVVLRDLLTLHRLVVEVARMGSVITVFRAEETTTTARETSESDSLLALSTSIHFLGRGADIGSGRGRSLFQAHGRTAGGESDLGSGCCRFQLGHLILSRESRLRTRHRLQGGDGSGGEDGDSSDHTALTHRGRIAKGGGGGSRLRGRGRRRMERQPSSLGLAL